MNKPALITLTESWHRSPWLYERLAYASPGDAILLMQDAVFALQSPILLSSFIAKCTAQEVSIYCLNVDCEMRGIEASQHPVQRINDQEWLELVLRYDKQVAF